MPADAFEGITPEQAKKFKSKFVKYLDVSQIRNLEPEVLESMPSKILGGIEDSLSNRQVNELSLLNEADGENIDAPVILMTLFKEGLVAKGP